MFKCDSLRRIGGYYAGHRIGYDTLILDLLLMVGRLSYLEEPLYHRLWRPNSLVNSPATGRGSEPRLRAWSELGEMYRQAFELYGEYLAGRIEVEALAKGIRRICQARIPRSEQEALQREAGRLREVMTEARR